MAKRKRLSALGMVGDTPPAERPAIQQVPPVARIAADAATQSALDDLAQELRSARDSGRMVVELPLDAVEIGHLHRDRMSFDPEDMDALKASLRDRGQQTPIEVVALQDGRYGLISGARRLTALRVLFRETGRADLSRVKALLRPAASAPDAYLAMVEENEIRSDLSFYERGRLAHEAARIGVFESPAEAVKALFIHVSASKRSKILNFVALHQVLGQSLRFPEAIPEKLGLALVKAAGQDVGFADRVAAQLQSGDPQDATAERSILDRALIPPKPTQAGRDDGDDAEEQELQIGQGVRMKSRPGRILLSGRGVTEDLARDLIQWLEQRG